MTTPVPGPPWSVLSAILRESPAHPYTVDEFRQASFSPTAMPVLPSLRTDEVFMPQFAFLDANVEVSGNLTVDGTISGGSGGSFLPLGGGTLTGALKISPAGTPAVPQLDVEGSTSGAGQLAFIKNTSAADGDHALTVEQAASGFANTVAGNFTSLSTLSSTVYVSGQSTQRGVLKISHQGYADGSDSGASAVSIDLQTTNGGSTGTAAQGIFITSTTDAAPAGNPFTVRYNSLDQFVLKNNGLVGIGVSIGHTPAGMVEIAQKDTSTVGLAMTAIAAGTDMINLKDSGGNQRFQINNAGNTIMRANAFFTTNAIIGSASSDFGGGSAALTICHATDPTTNPASGHVILYCDSSGNLLARTSAGNVRTVAAV